ncbi:MAG TPA: histidine kinase dimerization/phospho-acceptor domain-containing protein, partial [Anaeromyxobacteraceae bacterium]|nr:histidine kinase dimerization/phospho-acceptor domain-containing protein [Anaeromyxobacteraceae bacterium]
MQTTLRRRIVLPLVFLAFVAVVALAFLGRASWLEARTLRSSTENVQAATTLVFALMDAVHEEDTLALALRADEDDPELPARLAEAGVRVTRLGADITARRLPAPTEESWEAFLRARAALATVRDEIFEALAAGDEARLEIAFDKWNLVNDRSHALLRNFGAAHLRQLERTVDDLQRRRSLSLASAIAAIALGFVAAAVFAALVGRAVVRPIAAMASAAEATNEGSPSAWVPGAERRDEIGVLARSLNGMTERLVAANARLAEAVRARDEFLSVASHELKTPLTSLGLRLGQLSRLAARDGDDPVSRDVLARATVVMERQVATLTRLVASLLDVTRLTSGRLPLQREPTQV